MMVNVIDKKHDPNGPDGGVKTTNFTFWPMTFEL